MMDAIFSWNTLYYLLIGLYVPAGLGLIMIVLLQKGKGTGFAGAFGAGAGPGSDTVFGARSGQTLPVKLTYLAATIFVVISLSMAIIAPLVSRGSAPELVEGADASPATVSTGLEELGLGKGVQGSGSPSAAPAALTPEAEPSTEAPAAVAPASSDSAPSAPAEAAPAPSETPQP